MSIKQDSDFDKKSEEVWRSYMTTGKVPDYIGQPWFETKIIKPLFGHLPADPRCAICHYPFEGLGGKLTKILFGVEPSPLNPYLCNACERFAKNFQGGAEVEMSLLFADVRGSTSLAESMSPSEYSRLINRFYRATTKVLFDAHAMVEKLIGDAVNGFFVPGFAGPGHARVAIEAGMEILKATGHGDPAGPWIQVGVGVHIGVAFVGAIQTEGGAVTISVLGDDVNATARLGSLAGAGELIASQAAVQAAGWKSQDMQSRQLQLKGRKEGMDAWVIRV
ncbi:MAG: adenylate/guanylate cyclase domain-containing protein [Anaerolineales bacterium]|nr:MAG: adenylate/guanylate cyclase domain-containing protein [Anaerolineales bacterium]